MYISITNISGKEIFFSNITQPDTKIDISKLPKGVYFARLTFADLTNNIKKLPFKIILQ